MTTMWRSTWTRGLNDRMGSNSAFAIVPDRDPFEDGVPGLLFGLEVSLEDQFVFQAGPEGGWHCHRGAMTHACVGMVFLGATLILESKTCLRKRGTWHPSGNATRRASVHGPGLSLSLHCLRHGPPQQHCRRQRCVKLITTCRTARVARFCLGGCHCHPGAMTHACVGMLFLG